MGTLYVVATPIGNLEDITLRALRVLREVELIAAEDTRRTARLLQRYSIATPTTSLHEHNEGQKTPVLLSRLSKGASIALVSDAGTPLVSDPGRQLVESARREGHAVVAVPGPSAVTAILSAAGADIRSFAFLGFPPRKSSDLKAWIVAELSGSRPIVFFEAPHRVRLTLQAMFDILGDRPIWVGRELTKLHEELVNRPISAHLSSLQHPKGEFTLLVEGDVEATRTTERYPGDASAVDEIGRLANNGALHPREAAKRVAMRYGRPVNELYRLWVNRK